MYLLPEHEALVGDEHVQPPVHGGDGMNAAPTNVTRWDTQRN